MQSIVFLLSFLALSQGESIRSNTRIVNGQNAALGEFPFQVSLQMNGFHFCGGSVLSAFYVLTAAHCIYDKSYEDVLVHSGIVNINRPYKMHLCLEFKIHENYEISTSVNDIALIRVKPIFEFSDTVKPILLPAPHEDLPAGTAAMVSGWGRLRSIFSTSPDHLQKALIFVADRNECRWTMSQLQLIVRDTNICAYDSSMRRGQCNGDSGGPLSIGNKVIGIVSYSQKDPGQLCGSTKYPGVYTRISAYMDWIIDHATVEE